MPASKENVAPSMAARYITPGEKAPGRSPALQQYSTVRMRPGWHARVPCQQAAAIWLSQQEDYPASAPLHKLSMNLPRMAPLAWGQLGVRSPPR